MRSPAEHVRVVIWPCCSWTSTASRWSTTGLVTRPVTPCCAGWRFGCASAPARPTPSPGWVVMNSGSSSRTSTTRRMQQRQPSGWSTLCQARWTSMAARSARERASGLRSIVAIGAWVLREACRQARTWQTKIAGARDLRISVNVSARELVEGTFVEGVEAALADSRLAAGSLALEITESMMLADETAAIASLRRLRELGVHIVVDDFGTGYSSLSYLKRLPVDGLKIDRSFVEGLGEEREKSAIVRATIALARALGLTVTAEGIENATQLRRLLALQCDLGQGYHFAHPLAKDAMTALLAERPRYRLPEGPVHKRRRTRAA